MRIAAGYRKLTCIGLVLGLLAATTSGCTMNSPVDPTHQPDLMVPDADDLRLRLLAVDRIWAQGFHNAFTDLTRFQDRFYCVFREASGHVSPDGKIRILASDDGVTWSSSALIAVDGYDLRDPKITVHPDGRRMVINGGAAIREGSQPAIQEHSFVSFSRGGLKWSAPQQVTEVGQWLWRVTWHQGKAFGVAYDVRPESRSSATYGSTLMLSEDAAGFSPLVQQFCTVSGPTEATLRFGRSGTGYCLQRRDGRQENSALFGVSDPPYKEWKWTDLGRYLGGPNFIQIPSGHWIAAGRLIEKDEPQTALLGLDTKKRAMKPLLILPSGGDTSYPGLYWHDNVLWVSYYSSHEDRTSIYLAQVAVSK